MQDPVKTCRLKTLAAHLALLPRGLALLASAPPSMRRSLTAMVPPASALARWYPPGSTCRGPARLRESARQVALCEGAVVAVASVLGQTALFPQHVGCGCQIGHPGAGLLTASALAMWYAPGRTCRG